MSRPLVIPGLGAVTIDQLGMLTDDLAGSAERLSNVFGVQTWSVWTYGPETVPTLRFRGTEGKFRMKLALSDTKPQLELIQSLEGPSIYEEWLEANELGLHHVATVVPDLDGAVRAVEEAGLSVVQSGSGYGLNSDGGFAYLDTQDQLGLTVELIEVPKQRRDPEAVLTPLEGG